MTRATTIESALKVAYYDKFASTDTMARDVVNAVGAEPLPGLLIRIEGRIRRDLSEAEGPDFRSLAEQLDTMLPTPAVEGLVA